jgi:microcystin-dependent protein
MSFQSYGTAAGPDGIAALSGTGSPFGTDYNTTGIQINNASVSLTSAGGGGAHNNLPPYVCINFIIKYEL